MGIAVAVTFALSLWVVLTSLGVSAFDGILVALVIILAAAGARLLGRSVGSVGPGSRD